MLAVVLAPVVAITGKVGLAENFETALEQVAIVNLHEVREKELANECVDKILSEIMEPEIIDAWEQAEESHQKRIAHLTARKDKIAACKKIFQEDIEFVIKSLLDGAEENFKKDE